jgi:cell division protein FtsA
MRPLAALDIGAGKFACLIGSPTEAGAIEIAGVGRQSARRGPRGEQHDFEGAVRALSVAIGQAQRMAGVDDPRFALAYAGPDLGCDHVSGAAPLPRGVVEPGDVAAALDAARARSVRPGRTTLHVSAMEYAVDDRRGLLDPRGERGRMLVATLCVVHAPTEAIQATERLCECAGAPLEAIEPAPFLVGLAVLSEEERRDGAVVLDIGESRIGVAAFRNGALTHAETIAGGGARVTADLAARLGTTFGVAERAKHAYGGLGHDQSHDDAVELPLLGADGRLEPGRVLRGLISECVESRVAMLLARIATRLDEIGEGPGPGALGVALAGGASLTPGIRSRAMTALGRPVRMGQPMDFGGLDDSLDGPSFAAAAGLLRKRAETEAQHRTRSPSRLAAAAPILRRGAADAVAWIKENF